MSYTRTVEIKFRNRIKHKIISYGVTKRNGRPHAETIALSKNKKNIAGSTVYLTQYASIFDNGAQATFDADISGGNVRLRVTPSSTDNMTIKVIRQAIEV